jgi:hypothetical protein
MKQAAKATALVLAVSLLSGCSSAEDKACEAAQKVVEEDMNKAQELLLSAKDLDKNGYGLQANEVRGEILRTSEKLNRAILKNQSCFTPEQLVEAQRYLDKYSN